jgi:hypothetical protein
MVAVATVTVENLDHESVRVPSLVPPSGEQITSLPEYGVELSDIEGLSQSPVAGQEVQPRGSVTGVLLFHIPTRIARETVELEWQRDSSDSPPEIQWRLPPESGSERALPEFTIDSVSVPDSAAVGANFSFEAIVSNTGERDETFRGEIQYSEEDTEDYNPILTVAEEIPAGGSETFEIDLWEESTGTESLRLAPFTTADKVTFTEPEFSVGGTYSMVTGLEMTVEKIHPRKYEEYTYYAGSTETMSATHDRQFLFAYISAENTGEYSVALPKIGQIGLESSGNQYWGTSPWGASGKYQLKSPIEGMTWGTPDELESGNTYNGWVPFEVGPSVDEYGSRIHMNLSPSKGTWVEASWGQEAPNNS